MPKCQTSSVRDGAKTRQASSTNTLTPRSNGMRKIRLPRRYDDFHTTPDENDRHISPSHSTGNNSSTNSSRRTPLQPLNTMCLDQATQAPNNAAEDPLEDKLEYLEKQVSEHKNQVSQLKKKMRTKNTEIRTLKSGMEELRRQIQEADEVVDEILEQLAAARGERDQYRGWWMEELKFSQGLVDKSQYVLGDPTTIAISQYRRRLNRRTNNVN
ncbi:hypothetical protein FA15DRAFT_661883 [Coprinopsis marcescibilis]|uniref:Uncharacterized protein n=1 Tax=Coprinopsis marcescibilis TaxID=230819 RepID=A0A5C3K9S9_COPMA|nr:hypothetical protein FA15DRAFT_661883 [Coprinopsis marcescibilis]